MQLYEFNKVLYNEKNSNVRTWKKIKPVRFAIPVKIYKVNVIKMENSGNIFTETIVKLHKLGKKPDEIADIMCIDKRMVQSVLEQVGDLLNSDGIAEPKKNEEEQYIVYDCYNGCFFDSYINSDDINDQLETENLEIDYKTGKISFVKAFGDSRRITAYMLKSKNALHIPDENGIREYVESKKRNVYDRSTVYQYENLYDTYSAFLICTYFVPDGASSERLVRNPIYGETFVSNVKELLLRTLEKEKEDNQKLKELVDEMEKEIAGYSEDVMCERESDANRFISSVIRRYGKAEKSKYEPLISRLAELEAAYYPFSSPDIEQNEEKKQEASDKLAVAAGELIECLFALLAFISARDDNVRNTAKGYDRKSYQFILKNTFSDESDEVICGFAKRVRTDSVKGVISDAGSIDKLWKKHIDSLIMASVLLTHGTDNSPLDRLANKVPNFLELIPKIKEERGGGKHGGEDPNIYSAETAKKIFTFAMRTACSLLGIEAEENAEHIAAEAETADVDSLVTKYLNDYTVTDERLKVKVRRMVRAYIKKDSQFFSECYNCMQDIFIALMYPYLSQDALDSILGMVPGTLDEQRDMMNGILRSRGIRDEIRTPANVEKAIALDDFSNANISIVMQVCIVLADREPALLEQLRNCFGGIFSFTEDVKEKRGHNNTADFSDKAKEKEFKEIMDKILDYSTKITEAEDGQE